MADTAKRRADSGSDQRREQYYIDENAVRKLQTAPEKKEKRAERQVSHEARKNRAKALRMSRGYVLFLALVSVASLGMCVKFLQLKAVVTTQNETVAALESRLSKLKAENDALYNNTFSSVDLDEVKSIAMNRLGMQTADEDQIVGFSLSGNSYVRQYQDVPDAE